MKHLYYGVGGLLLLSVMAAALAYAIPAAWVAQHLTGAAGGRVQLAHARGLWHHGSGVLVLSSGAGGANAVHWAQRVDWDVKPQRSPLLWALRVTWPEVGPPLPVMLRLGLSGWTADVAPWRGVIPLSALAGLGAPFNTLGLEGEAQIGLSALQFSSVPNVKPTAEPNMEINIARLRSAMAQGVVLGDYVLRGHANAAGGAFALRTTQGALLLDGTGQCRAHERASRLSCGFEGTARAARHDDALIGNLLGLLGKQQIQSSSKNPITELRW